MFLKCPCTCCNILCFSSVALVQPSVATSQEAVKETPFSTMIPPTSTIPGSFMPSGIPGPGIFPPVGVQTQQPNNEKIPQSADGMGAAADLTLQGELYITFCEHLFIRVVLFDEEDF